MNTNHGRVTIPTNLDVVPETIEILKRWGADAIRDCDGTEFPEELTKVGAKIYSTYYTTRKDNEWAKANPDEVQQCYIMTGFYTAMEGALSIPLMKGISDELMQQAHKIIKIPMDGEIDSLNAAVAAGILMYEAVRT